MAADIGGSKADFFKDREAIKKILEFSKGACLREGTDETDQRWYLPSNGLWVLGCPYSALQLESWMTCEVKFS